MDEKLLKLNGTEPKRFPKSAKNREDKKETQLKKVCFSCCNCYTKLSIWVYI